MSRLHSMNGSPSGLPLPEQTWIVIAAYREGDVVGDVIRELRNDGWNVVVVDDGSDDDTAQHAVTAGAVVLRHLVNLGQGAALRTGFKYVLEAKTAEYVVTFDADGQHRSQDITGLVEPLMNGTADVVLGSRFLRPLDTESMPRLRRAVLMMAARMARLTTGLALTDTHNGLRAFKRQALIGMELQQDRMAHASEIQTEIARLRLRCLEAPVRVSYTPYSMAKGQRLTGVVSILWDLLVAKLR